VLSILVGALFNRGVDQAASTLVATIQAYKKQTGVYPESLMQMVTADNVNDLSRNRIKYGSRVHYRRSGGSFDLSYDSYPFNGRMWDAEKNAFVDVMD
jgi:hypothetical protein